MGKDHLVIMPMPTLVAVLLAREREKGAPLTEAEVFEIRETAACVMVPHDVAAQIAEERGYEDIRPDHAWEDWNAVGSSLGLENLVPWTSSSRGTPIAPFKRGLISEAPRDGSAAAPA